MAVTIITNIIIMAIMFSFSFFVFKSSIKRINDKTKKYFLEKLQQYTYLIDEKEEKLADLENSIKEQSKKVTRTHDGDEQEENSIFSSEIEKRLQEMKQYKTMMEKQKHSQEEVVYDIPTPQYKEENFFDTYKKLKSNFKQNNEEIIRDFISKHNETKETKRYNILRNFRKQFTDKAIYELLTITNVEQYQIVKEVMSEDVEKILNFNEKFKNPQKFVVTKLIDELDEKIKRYNEIILSEIDRTLDIMDNFSEYTKINIETDLMDLDELISDTVKGLNPLFTSNNIKVIYNYDDEIFINGDYRRLKQVLVNTLKNSTEAIESEGRITLKIRKTKKFVFLYIKDNGCGMTSEELKQIGELFYSSKEKGCGVGVALSSEIIKLHGGELKYKSVFGEYTEAIIKLPIVNNLQ